MRQTEINNQIVLLRQHVHQARICVISKLIREAKKLRTHSGNDKQLERNKNKSDKLLREVFALKRIKDDEISKFGTINFENLQDILKNARTDDATRAMIKVARYKCLHQRIGEFVEKFPDYSEYICWKKKRGASKRKGSNSIDDFPEENRKRSRYDTNTIKVATSNGAKKNTRSAGNISDSQCTSSEEKQNNDDNNNKKKIKKEFNELLEESAEQKLKGNECKSATKVISKEAAVKRFTQVLQETGGEEESRKHEENNSGRMLKDVGDCRKRSDDFFLSSDEAVRSGSSVVTVLPADRRNDRGSEVDDGGAFKALRIRGKEKFSRDSRRRDRGTGRKENIDGTDVLHDAANSVKKRSVTRYTEESDMQVKNKLIKRNIDNSTKGKADEKLHPSWIARRKQQEIMKQGFQGKIIKFDED